MTRHIASAAEAMVLTFQTCVIGASLSCLALPFIWTPPPAVQWTMLAGIGVIATIGHSLITLADEQAEASLLAPLAFKEIIMTTVVGWWFFNDLPDRWTVLGVALLIASAIHISLYDHKTGTARWAGCAPARVAPPDAAVSRAPCDDRCGGIQCARPMCNTQGPHPRLHHRQRA